MHGREAQCLQDEEVYGPADDRDGFGHSLPWRSSKEILKQTWRRSNGKVGNEWLQRLAALFDASSEALRLLAADPRFIGINCPGFFGVLHTWGRSLPYHPHVHYVVAGGGPSEDGATWLPSRANFFVPVKALSKIFRAKFRDALRQAGLLQHIDPAVWRKAWVVHSQPAGNGRAVVKYLAPYVFRVAIS